MSSKVSYSFSFLFFWERWRDFLRNAVNLRSETDIFMSGTSGGGGGGGGGATRPGTEKRCSHKLQSDPPGSDFKKGGGGKFAAVISPVSAARVQCNDLQHVLCAFYILVPLQNDIVK